MKNKKGGISYEYVKEAREYFPEKAAKEQGLIEKFPTEFREMMQTSPIANRIFCGLLNGMNEYEVIYYLLKTVEDNYKVITELVYKLPPKEVVLKEFNNGKKE